MKKKLGRIAVFVTVAAIIGMLSSLSLRTAEARSFQGQTCDMTELSSEGRPEYVSDRNITRGGETAGTSTDGCYMAHVNYRHGYEGDNLRTVFQWENRRNSMLAFVGVRFTGYQPTCSFSFSEAPNTGPIELTSNGEPAVFSSGTRAALNRGHDFIVDCVIPTSSVCGQTLAILGQGRFAAFSDANDIPTVDDPVPSGMSELVSVPSVDSQTFTVPPCSEPTGTPVSESASGTTSQHVINLDKIGDQESVNVGSQMRWTLTARNTGPTTLSAVTISDPLPPGLEMVLPAPEGVSYERLSRTVSKSIDTLAVGDSFGFSYSTSVLVLSQILAQANVASAEGAHDLADGLVIGLGSGSMVPEPSPAPPQEVAGESSVPELAFTGRQTNALAVVGFTLMTTGAATLWVARRRRSVRR